MRKNETQKRRRVVVTGGPGGGKTTALDFFRREIGAQIVIVPEAATMIFFESAAVGGMGIEGGNPIRSESMDEAVELNSRLRAIWEKHPNFMVVAHDPSFFKEIGRGLDALSETIRKLSP
ncbi:MAG: AAA family ATPase [Akkermansiaceae bacterium]|jgi:adenylate kinase